MKLDIVQVIFRHGARAPSREEARIINVTDPTIYESVGFNELTNHGKEQSNHLGSLLRKEYNEFLGNYHPEDLYAYTSASSRTKMTLELVLDGLYPITDEEKCHLKLQQRSIPIKQATKMADVIVTPYQYNKYRETFEIAASKSEDYKKQMSKYSDLFEYVSKLTGINYMENLVYNCGWTFYALHIHKLLNLPLPSWCTEEIYKSVRELFVIVLKCLSMTPELIRMNGGTLVRKILENIESNKTTKIPKKIYLYSTHDFTIASVSNALKLDAFDIPPFGCALIFDKFRDESNQEYIRVRSWDGSSENFKTLKLWGFEDYCPLEYFKEMTKDVIPTDEEIDALTSLD